MDNSLAQLERFQRLRIEAEHLIRQRPEVASSAPTDILELIHELKIYQAELEIQNEELRRAQHEIIALQHEYESLYEFAPCGYVTLNPNGIITRINLTGVTLLGVTRQKIQRTSFSQYIAPEFEDAFFAARRKAGAIGEKQSLELLLKREAREPLWVRADIEPVRAETGEVLQWRIMFSDISERLQVEAQRKKLVNQLQQAQKMQSMGTLAGGIAHEFNNILTIILGNVELALDVIPQGNPAAGFIQETKLAGMRAKEVVNQLLSFTRMNLENKRPLSMASLVEDAMRFLRSSIPANIEIQSDLHADLNPVMADATQIHQIIINLFSNAADAMLADGGILKIELDNVNLSREGNIPHSSLHPGRYVRLTISDTGHGMDDETKMQVFDPYFTTKAIGKGTGMGLAVVHGIVENHEGAIIVESRPGDGSTFALYLPATLAQEELALEKPTGIEQLSGSEWIMFIDDETGITNFVKRQLEQLGYRVETFSRPLDALKRFESAPREFDLVITDMAMPAMTGEQLIAKLLRIRQDLPIILCTGYSERVDPNKAAELGINAILIKPYSPGNLSITIRSALDEAEAAEKGFTKK